MVKLLKDVQKQLTPDVAIKVTTGLMVAGGGAMLAVPKRMWNLFAHGRPPWEKVEKSADPDVPLEPDRHHKQLLRWVGFMALSMAGVVTKLTLGDDMEKNRKPMCEVLAGVCAAGVAMDGVVMSQENPGQNENATIVDAAMGGTLAAMNFIASRDVDDE